VGVNAATAKPAKAAYLNVHAVGDDHVCPTDQSDCIDGDPLGWDLCFTEIELPPTRLTNVIVLGGRHRPLNLRLLHATV
jgi:hypothetical protein